ncbi:hypothetical protein [Mucilaginibacter sp. CSA2-8R]|uniref:hypothetical protein n=1 Tax=Mucilaginibacter sp. CSA2-8R TaxID=3141542 RepID=UPI00315D8FFA
MNNTFEPGRFARLYQKHTVEHLKTYLLSIAVLAGLLLVCLGFFWNINKGALSLRAQANVFVFFYLVCGAIFTSLSFTYLSEKKQAIPVLTLPVSHFEKYLVSWIYTFVVYQLVFIGVFFLVDGFLFSIGAPYQKDDNEMINIFAIDQKIYVAIIVYILLHAAAFWGAVYFQKLHFIKTSFVVFACAFLLTVLNNIMLRSLIKPDARGAIPFLGTSFTEHGHYYNIGVTGVGYAISTAVVLVAIAILLWTTAYFKLKEKEV